MRKIVSIFLLMNILFANLVFASKITDDLANKLDRNLKIEKVKIQKIEDEFVQSSLNSNLKIEKNKKVYYEDDLLKYIDKTKLKPIVKNKIDFNFEEGKIKVSPLKYQTTRVGLYEGGDIDFALAQDTNIKNNFYKKGTIVKARVETLSKNMAYGVPADLVVGNFTLPNGVVLSGQIERQGANRAIWVYPIGYMLTPFFLMGVLLYPIRGGHAKLYPSKIYEVEI